MADLRVKNGGVWTTPNTVYVKEAGVWKECSAVHVREAGSWKEVWASVSSIPLTISANVANFNLFTALGSPLSAVDVVVTIDAGVQVYSTLYTNPSFDTSGLPIGSTITLINNGLIYGAGAVGGRTTTGSSGSATPGSTGGTAIYTTVPMTITNAGSIFGGGGGGGAVKQEPGDAGCGGGGGQGQVGGLAGAEIIDAQYTVSIATNGSVTAPGNGGYLNVLGGQYGNRGGYWGEAGLPGISNDSLYVISAGGTGGKSINANGNAITWISGNNSTQVKGAQV